MAMPAQCLWVPLFLQRRALLSFALLFAILAVVIGILDHISCQNQGLATPAKGYRYFWTYVPSFTFTVISGFWFLVESNTKVLAPWRAIVERPDTLAHSLRLDYNDEFRYMTLFTSAKHAHWSVFLAVVGTFSLNILIVLSTGLLAVQQRLIVDSDANFTLSTIFEKTDKVKFPTEGLSTTHGLRYGLPFPDGTTATFAHQILETTNFANATTAWIQVDAFYPQASCEVVNGDWSFGYVQNGKNLSEVTPGIKRVVQFPGCERRDAWAFFMDPGLVQTAAGIETYSLSVLVNPCDKEPFGLGSDATFEHFAVLAGSMTFNGTNMSMAEARRTYSRSTFTNSTVKIGEDVYGDSTIYFKPEPSVMLSSQIATVVCTTAPKLGKAELTVARGAVRAVAKPTLHDAELDSALGWRLQQAIYSSFQNDAPYLTGYNYTPFQGSDLSLEKYSAQDAPFFQLLNDTDTRKAVKDFINVDFLMRSVPVVLDRIAVQIAGTDYFIPSTEKVAGTMSVEMDRLVVLPLYLGFTIGILALVTLISAALCIWSEGVVSCDPATIAGMTLILAERPGLLTTTQELSQETDEKKRRPRKHESTITVKPKSEDLLLKDGTKISIVSEPEATLSHRKIWWRPWSALLAVRISVLLLPCVGIAVLEVLLQLSKRHNGIATISPNDYVRYAWVHVPVLTIFCLNSFFDASSYTSRTIQPYSAMHRRPTPASRSIEVDLFHRTTLSALCKAIQLGHLGVVAAIAATLLGWSLPIAASGLFSARTVQERNDVALHQTTLFDPSASLVSSSVVHDNFLPLPGLILYNNLSYPRWTYGKYALPHLTPANVFSASTILNASDAVFRVELPAIYGVANCTPQNKILWSVNFFENRTFASDDGRIMPFITLESKTPHGCPPMPCNLDSGSDKFHMAKWRSFADVQYYDAIVNPSSEQTSSNMSTPVHYAKDFLPAHCPQSVMCTARGIANAKYIHGIKNNNTGPTLLESGKLMHCSPYVEQETVRLELSLPNFGIIPSKPPVPVVGTRKFFSAAELVNEADFSWYLPRKLFLDAGDRPAEFDHFFEAMFSGSKGIDPVSVADTDAYGIRVLFDRIDEIYGTIVAQVYSEKRRFATPIGNSTFDLNGTIVTSSASRMQQDELSTRIIQGVLAAMIFCAIISMMLTRAQRILPERPCSIATSAGLLARSSLLEKRVLPLDDDAKSDDSMQEKGVQEDALYSLGWWGQKGDRWYGIDAGKAEKEE